ncbi:MULTISPECIES: ThuA domain-containing protein [unclassified Streptomyces]|uniref:ThuA domain-containing protein n=1 Tax=Streptomyces sp. NBC_00119 TaxID=2975659 RepID=A0AAU1UHV0_9ACTN|nr:MULTISPECIES: ThuA domain-containing protein [unclassified Streptomyces]MCX4647951.1 ThuA domain-containing protein [Streptomyces sp. NBC_01446]MCX5320529.1 ThuA domain-containing protein [Streptomyces sp. NBC_00120]
MPHTGHLSDVLVYTRTTGYRHDSIHAGTAALRELGEAHGFTVEASENPAVFTDASLAGRSAVVFLSTSGEVLTPDGQAALRRWIADGGGLMGVHSAAYTEYQWPYYGDLLGARFARHPAVQPGTVLVEDQSHPAMAHLPLRWDGNDEWYDFRSNPRRPGVRVLATIDESGYEGGGMGDDHPVVWCKEFGAGRSVCTTLGHAIDAYTAPALRRHLLGGLRWASGAAGGPSRSAAADLPPARCARPRADPPTPAGSARSR